MVQVRKLQTTTNTRPNQSLHQLGTESRVLRQRALSTEAQENSVYKAKTSVTTLSRVGQEARSFCLGTTSAGSGSTSGPWPGLEKVSCVLPKRT